MELRHLRYFSAVVEHKGFREAARALHITQSALTQAIQDLEEEIGTLLLDRRTRPPKLTRAGEVFLSSTKAILREATIAVTHARQTGKSVTGTLRIGFIPFATHHFLPNLLRGFKEKFPSVELQVSELTPSAQWKAFSQDAIDIGFTRELTVTQRAYLSESPLFEVPLVAIVRRDSEFGGPSIHIQQLRNTELILLPRKESPVLYDSIVSLCREAGFLPRINSFPHLAESMVTLVEAGQGVAILPIWAKVFADARLRCILLEPRTVRTELVAVWRTKDHSREVTSFLNLLDTQKGVIQAATERMIAL